MTPGRALCMGVIVQIMVQFAFAGGGLAQTGAGKGPSVMRVDWQDAEVRKFLAESAASPRFAISAEDESKLAKLKLPVLAFGRPPGLVGRAFGVERAPQRKRTLVTDPENPNWYTIVDEYGDVTISVDGDLRVQQELPASVKIYTPPPSLTAEPEINVIESKVGEGMEGLLAEYTVRKFPDIPYRITIECAGPTKQHCADKEALLRDRSSLEIISARPPAR